MGRERIGGLLLARGVTGALMILAAVVVVVALVVGWLQGFFGSLESAFGGLQMGEDPPGIELDPEEVAWLGSPPGFRAPHVDVGALRSTGQALRVELDAVLPVSEFSSEYAETTEQPYDCGWARTCRQRLLVGVRQSVAIESRGDPVTMTSIVDALNESTWRAAMGPDDSGVLTVYAVRDDVRLQVSPSGTTEGRFTGELRWN